MKSQIHSVDNLYTFIQNIQIMDDLDAEIAKKEADLARVTNLETFYKNLGCTQMLDISARSYNKLTAEITFLKLKRNKVEKSILEFELHTLLEN